MKRTLLTPALAVLAATATTAALTLAGGPSAGAAPAKVKAHPIKVHPDARKVADVPHAATFSCQTVPIDGSQGARCYSPAEIQTAYGVAPLLATGRDGTGRTIVIIDAYQNPYIADDLTTFDESFELAAPPSFTNVVMPGTPKFDKRDPNQVSWAEESTLDVEWAHAIAPGARIVLVSAKSSEDTDILSATQLAVDQNLGDVISQSFGENDTCVDPQLLSQQHAMFQQAVAEGITPIASSGDSGAAQFNCGATAATLAASSPASDTLVTGVGGTTLDADNTGSYVGETAWTEPLFGCNPPAVDAGDINCSGGGLSATVARPSFQNGLVKGSGRGVPDVAYNAGVNGGVLTVCSVCNKGKPAFFLFGGTSAGTPQWSAITAIGDQIAGHRLGSLNPALYGVAGAAQRSGALHDITTGNNDVVELDGFGYSAGRSWDPVTGLGTPNAAKLLPMLIGAAG
ncbi:MAG TPA: S53 family peptidase [Nocardioides sp.]|nr:S53 family peptidase [Nocardioides sp.]